MKVRMHNVTPNGEDNIVEIARVSSTRVDKQAEPHKLIGYLIRNRHWSPFEHASMTIEIHTSRAIAAQILRHRSFKFQEFSQRYQDVTKLDGGQVFEDIELRKSGSTNRQSSLEAFDPLINNSFGTGVYRGPASKEVLAYLDHGQKLYSKLVQAGVALECARMVLPLATKTKLYMTGDVRCWIHFLNVRDDEHAQKEIRDIAKRIKVIFIRQFPDVSKALGWGLPKVIEVVQPTRKKRVILSLENKQLMKQEQDSLTTVELADKYNVSLPTVRKICK